MFKIATTPTYFAPVVVDMPIGGGKTQKFTFDAEFRRLTQSELKDIQAQASSGEITDERFAREVMIGWRGVQDEAGTELPFSEGNCDMLLNIFPVLPSVVKAFYASLSGAAVKN